MRRNRIAPLLGLMLVLSFGAISASAATKTATIHIKGMHCKMCSASVAKALKATEGVEKVDVSDKEGTAVIQYDDQKVTEAKLREVINETGFEAVEEKTAASKNTGTECCCAACCVS